MKFRPLPDLERVRELLNYDPLTGIFIWKVTRGSILAGAVAGTDAEGYIQIMIDGVPRRSHRLAWLLMTGLEPDGAIDHEDLDRANNRWLNLRQAGDANNRNKGKYRNNKSGYKGVHAYRGSYQAQICAKGIRHHLGYFNDPAEAHAAYCAKALELHGDFARTA